ncbi:T9SS type A sorting domain-containing protein [Pontibacter sp. G13]|uniref:T9SS type A sorting domain-containing protein n=1 Tax=Pontibacter sp. G13 TaxID=3074898 RepID=UPI00288C1262|nr:T9SS type A sorting domain-containing protein [Pontibacter sp. G13]WNJ19034.1 T9SS type A sorting domain-containing protein [Pontibacter sp. G13]
MKNILLLLCLFASQSLFAQVQLDADGPGGTYALITSVLAPGHNPIEAPDCNHGAFGDHIDEVFDSVLNAFVFRFHIHTSPDNDRCINFDRQRNEIKSYDQSPDNLLGVDGETVRYSWKFKLDAGFQSSSSFTHIHQLKSVGGSLASMPMYTLTTRKSSPDRIELRYAETDNQITLKQTDLAPFLGEWVSVTETIQYGTSGTYEIEMVRLSDSTVLLAHSETHIVNWRPGADFVRPKWGIYRSLNQVQDLRDEAVLFANFEVDEWVASSVQDAKWLDIQLLPNPVSEVLKIQRLPHSIHQVMIFGLDGKLVLKQSVKAGSDISLNVSGIPNGTYLVHLLGDQSHTSRKICIIH